MRVFFSCFATLLLINLIAEGQKVNLAQVFSDAEVQTKLMLAEVAKSKDEKKALFSPRTFENGELKLVSSRDWTAGFFPGQLWMLFEYTGKSEWKTQAMAFTANMEREKTNAGTHDMGFKMYCSYGSGYKLTKDASYKDVIIESARTLMTRFKPTVGAIKSWDHRVEWGFPVIIDNMMNLELLFAATKLTGDSSFYKIAVTHANTTLKNHFQADNSSYHVIDYDTISGIVKNRQTHQGYSDESAWARGQAWGLYGYTMTYRETGDKKYLEQAERIAKFIFSHPNMPQDLIPYYDYNAPSIPSEPRDASAAAIAASALYELSTYSKNGKKYRATADKIVKNLTEKYRSPLNANKGFILLHSTGNKPANGEIDVPINYADYYYLEALMRRKKLR